MQFTAYYTDDRVYKGDYDDWLEMPASGALVIVEHRPTGRGIFNGGDWYFVREGVIGHVRSGPWGTQKPPPEISCKSCVKAGVGVSDEEFQRVSQRALRETRGL